jgi:sporulation protein YlmC with PRC-barrel domain
MRSALLAAAGVVLCGVLPAHGQEGVRVRETETTRTEVYRVSALMETKVTIERGDTLGQVVDLVINEHGCIDYLIVRYEDEELIAVPWGVVTYRSGEKVVTITAEVPKEKLREVTFRRGSWPNFREERFLRAVRTVWGARALRREGGEDRREERRDDRRDERRPGTRPDDRRPDDRRPDDRRPTDRRPEDRRPTDRRTDDRRPDERRPGTKPEDRRPDDRRPTDRRTDDRRPDDRRPGTKPDDRRPDDRRPTDRPSGTRPDDRKPTDRPSGTRPDDRKPMDQRPTDRRPQDRPPTPRPPQDR